MREQSTSSDYSSRHKYIHMVLPTIFSICVWLISASPEKAVEIITIPQVFVPASAGTNIDKDLAPESLYDSFLLGEIAAKLEDAASEDVSLLLEKASKILHLNETLTVKDVTEGVPQAIHLKEAKGERLKKFRGAFSFVGVLSVIAAIGILATLAPVLFMVGKALHLDVLWKMLIASFSWLRHAVDPLLYNVALLMLIASLHYPKGGSRSQLAILAAGFAVIVFTIRTMRKAKFNHVLLFIWCFSFLVPMALLSGSRFLGFFAVGPIFGALGFIAFPMPFGWAAGFQDEMSLDRCMFVSLIILFASLGARAGLYPIPEEVMRIFETGAAVFGMLSFGLGGLIKSMMGPVHPLSFIYPISWLGLAYLGSIYSYDSLANTSITFVVLWISQFYWRLAGVNLYSVFIGSWVLFFMTFWLKTHTDFLVSLFKV